MAHKQKAKPQIKVKSSGKKGKSVAQNVEKRPKR
jgi:hypothetical protein